MLTEKRLLETEIAERQTALQAVEVLLARIRQQSGAAPPDSAMPAVSVNGNGRRVRGTLKAAKRAAELLPGTFTRADLFAKVEADNPALAGRISAEVQRSTMRTLINEGWIFTAESTPGSSEARYRNVSVA